MNYQGLLSFQGTPSVSCPSKLISSNRGSPCEYKSLSFYTSYSPPSANLEVAAKYWISDRKGHIHKGTRAKISPEQESAWAWGLHVWERVPRKHINLLQHIQKQSISSLLFSDFIIGPIFSRNWSLRNALESVKICCSTALHTFCHKL